MVTFVFYFYNKNYKILAIFSNTDVVALFFKPSLIIEEKEIHYFFDSLEKTLQEGFWQIVLKFASNQSKNCKNRLKSIQKL